MWRAGQGEAARTTVIEDHPDGPGRPARAAALRDLGVTVVASPGPDQLAVLIAACDLVVPSPGVPGNHRALSLALEAGRPVRSELELAGALCRRRGRRLVAVTGTNGKTTVTTLVTSMLVGAGIRAVAAGNIGRPLIAAIDDPVDILVVETSSFQLAFTERFRARGAALLNLAPDHLDWHGGFAGYRAAKARVMVNQDGADLLVWNAEDEEVVALAAGAPARQVAFSTGVPGPGRYGVAGGMLVRPDGKPIIPVDELPSALPHDLGNALAASALAFDLGATDEAVTTALRVGARLPHRLALVGQAGGVRFFDDSKATNPSATVAAVRGFDSVVLIAGGRNKGLDLGALTAVAARVRAVVAIGEAAPEVEAGFRSLAPVLLATTMRQAVMLAAEQARPGDAVLLSPACASFDWYAGYAERGADFAAAVRQLPGLSGPGD